MGILPQATLTNDQPSHCIPNIPLHFRILTCNVQLISPGYVLCSCYWYNSTCPTLPPPQSFKVTLCTQCVVFKAISKKKLIELKPSESWVKPTFFYRKDVWQARCPGRHVWRACRRRLQVPNERLAAENQHLEQLKTCQIIPPSVNFSVGQGVTTCRPASLQKIAKSQPRSAY